MGNVVVEKPIFDPLWQKGNKMSTLCYPYMQHPVVGDFPVLLLSFLRHEPLVMVSLPACCCLPFSDKHLLQKLCFLLFPSLQRLGQTPSPKATRVQHLPRCFPAFSSRTRQEEAAILTSSWPRSRVLVPCFPPKKQSGWSWTAVTSVSTEDQAGQLFLDLKKNLKQRWLLLAFQKRNQNTQEVKNERFLISTRQNNVRIFGIRCL